MIEPLIRERNILFCNDKLTILDKQNLNLVVALLVTDMSYLFAMREVFSQDIYLWKLAVLLTYL